MRAPHTCYRQFSSPLRAGERGACCACADAWGHVKLVRVAPDLPFSCSPPVQGDYVGLNTGNGEKLSYSQAKPGQLLGCSLVSLHFRCQIPRPHSVVHLEYHKTYSTEEGYERNQSIIHSAAAVCNAEILICNIDGEGSEGRKSGFASGAP